MSLLHLLCATFTYQLCNSLNTWQKQTFTNKEIWKSTSDFIPTQSQSYGNIKLGQIMNVEFDWIWHGRTNHPRTGYPENFFRIGYSATDSSACQGQLSRYPSFWLTNNRDSMHVSVSSGTHCSAQQSLNDYGNIIKGISYHIRIAFNNTNLSVEISNNYNPIVLDGPDWYKTWPRNPTQSTFLGTIVPIWWMSNKYTGTNYNIGNGTFSNITIISTIFPTNSPSISPSLIPTISTIIPTNIPTILSPQPSVTPSNTPTHIPSNTPSLSPILSYLIQGEKQSQLILQTNDSLGIGKCNFTCWKCLQQIDIIGGYENNVFDFIFIEINTTECICPNERGISQNNDKNVNIGIQNSEYQLQIEKYILNQGNYDTIKYGIRVNVIQWENNTNNCSVNYSVNQNEFLGIQAENVLIIKFIICNSDKNKLNKKAILIAEKNYNKQFAQLFNVSLWRVNTSIEIGDFCELKDNKRRLLNNENDEEVTVVIVFVDANDAKAAENNACDTMEIEYESCNVSVTTEEELEEVNVSIEDELMSVDKAAGIACILVVIVCLLLFVLYCVYSIGKTKEKNKLENKYRDTGDKNGIISKPRSDTNKIQNGMDILVNGIHIDVVGVSERDPNMPKWVIGISKQCNNKGVNINIDNKKELSSNSINFNIISQEYESENDMIDNVNSVDISEMNSDIPKWVNTYTINKSRKCNNNLYKEVNNKGESSDENELINIMSEDLEYKSEKDMIDNVILNNKAYLIEMNDLLIDKQIGKGQFGCVYKAQWEGNTVVVKQLNSINENVDDNNNRKKEMLAEIILASLLPPHNNLVEIFGYIRSPFGVVMRYMSGDSVEKFVYRKYKKNTNDKILNIIEILIILKKAASGLKYLHKYGLIHRDIACRNILLGKIKSNGYIDELTEVRISDFGLTRQLNDNNLRQKTQSTFGPLKWMAPESIKDKIYSKKSDIYMFGITMWEIFYGCQPYININLINVAMDVVNNNLRPKIINNNNIYKYKYIDMPNGYKILMENCWNEKPQKRPTFKYIVNNLNYIQLNPVKTT